MRSLVFWEVLCRLLFVLLILITPLVRLNMFHLNDLFVYMISFIGYAVNISGLLTPRDF